MWTGYTGATRFRNDVRQVYPSISHRAKRGAPGPTQSLLVLYDCWSLVFRGLEASAPQVINIAVTDSFVYNPSIAEMVIFTPLLQHPSYAWTGRVVGRPHG